MSRLALQKGRLEKNTINHLVASYLGPSSMFLILAYCSGTALKSRVQSLQFLELNHWARAQPAPGTKKMGLLSGFSTPGSNCHCATLVCRIYMKPCDASLYYDLYRQF